ncbi:MAG: hypothetical protein ACLQBX_10330 [Candidatus Limnocylindrales bacterium]
MAVTVSGRMGGARVAYLCLVAGSPPCSAGLVCGVQAHGAGHAHELNRADLPEGDRCSAQGVDDLLADQHHAGSSALGDPRGDVYRLAVLVALLEDHRSGVQADVRRRQPGLGYARHHLEGGDHTPVRGP